MARPLIGSGTAILVGIIGAAGAGYGDTILSAVHTATSGLLAISKSATDSAKRLGADADVVSAVNKQLERTISEMKDFVVRETARSQPQSIHIVNSNPGSKWALLFKLVLVGGAGYACLRICGYGIDDVSVVTRHTLDATAASLKEKIHLIQEGCERGFQSLTAMIMQYRQELSEMRERMTQSLNKVEGDVTTVRGKVDEVAGTMTRMEDKVTKTNMGIRLLCHVVAEQVPQSPASATLMAYAQDSIKYENAPAAISGPSNTSLLPAPPAPAPAASPSKPIAKIQDVDEDDPKERIQKIIQGKRAP